MTHEEIRALLLRPEAVRRLQRQLDVEWLTDVSCGSVAGALSRALGTYADEAARTIAQALCPCSICEAGERDAAVAAEREACARVADEARIPFALTEDQDDGAGWMADTIADEIRARARDKVPPTGRRGGPTPPGEEADGAAGDHVKGRESPSDPAPAPSASGAERDAARRRVFQSGPGFVRAVECPDCGHTTCGESCVCNCDAARAEEECSRLRIRAGERDAAVQALLIIAEQIASCRADLSVPRFRATMRERLMPVIAAVRALYPEDK